MQIFGISFILFFLKLSDGSGYWLNLRNSDEETYRQAVKVQRINKKLLRCELAIKFLTRCRDTAVFPKFTRWKNANSKHIKSRNKYRRKVLLEEIKNKHREVRNLRNEVQEESRTLYEPMTYLRRTILKWSIQRILEAEKKLVEKRHEKKLRNLLDEKARVEGTETNPNKLIWNLSSHTLSKEEEETLKFGLRHGIAVRPDDNEILASAEALWHQIENKGLCRDNASHARLAKNQIRAMAFNLINIEEKQFFKDRKMINTIRTLKEKIVLLNPDKGNGVVLLDKTDYKDSLGHLFSDRTKFRTLDEDPTNSRLATLQNFLRTLRKRNEIDENEFKAMFPDNAKIGRAHGTAKIHKEYERIPPLRPIVDTIVGKYITMMLNPLTQNEYSLKDSFQAAEKINSIPNHLFEEGFRFVSFDVKSLFTNVPLQKTIQVILDRVYNKKLIQTKLKKRTLKKLILDTCSKTAFLCNGVVHEQIDGVSMGASLGPVLANIIMTELERSVVDQMIQDGTLKFYVRYVDDTLLLCKQEDVDGILARFNAYHQNLEFTVDKFQDSVPHFLDLEIHPDGISIFRKETHTAQYTNYNSFAKWNHQIAWIRSLVTRAKRLVNPSKLHQEIAKIRKFAAYNGFPKWITKNIIRRTLD